MFGLRTFDSRELVARVLPGAFRNTIRVLVPDSAAEPRGFHDVILENLSATPDYRAKMVFHRDITSLQRRWPSLLFTTMHKQQADMATLHRDCKQQYDGEFGGSRDMPPLWRACDMQSVPSYHQVPLGARVTLVVSGGMVFGLEGVCAGLP